MARKYIDDMQAGFRRQGAPVTMGIIVGLAVVALFFFLFRGQFRDLLAFITDQWWLRPWTLLTYPFAFDPLVSGGSLIFFLILLMWLYWVGTSVEHDLGSRRFAIFVAALTVVGSLSIWVGSLALQGSIPLAGPLLPVGALTVAWAARNPTMPIRLYGTIPITGLILLWLTVGIVVVEFGRMALLLAAFALVPLGVAYLFAKNRIPNFTYSRPVVQHRPSKAEQERERACFDDVKRREQERQERERLRKLFEGSLRDEDEK